MPPRSLIDVTVAQMPAVYGLMSTLPSATPFEATVPTLMVSCVTPMSVAPFLSCAIFGLAAIPAPESIGRIPAALRAGLWAWAAEAGWLPIVVPWLHPGPLLPWVPPVRSPPRPARGDLTAPSLGFGLDQVVPRSCLHRRLGSRNRARVEPCLKVTVRQVNRS
jgi:hypothetical protein